MIIDKLVAVLKGLCGSSEKMSKRIESLENVNRRLLQILDCPTGKFTVRGTVNTSPEELRVAMQNSGQFDLEKIQIDVQFSEALYIAVSPKNHAKIKQLLESKQVTYLQTLLESHKDLNSMAMQARDFQRNANANLRDHIFEIKENIEKKLTTGENSAVAKLDISAEKLKRQNIQIENALKTLNQKIEEITKLEFQMRGVVADHVPPSNQIYRPGGNKR